MSRRPRGCICKNVGGGPAGGVGIWLGRGLAAINRGVHPIARAVAEKNVALIL